MTETPVLQITRAAYQQMVAHCLDEYPLEGCGLLASSAGEASDVAGSTGSYGSTDLPGSNVMTACYPAKNAAASSRVYTIDPGDHLRADRDAEDRGLEITGVFHSHTHTRAYPSLTDVGQAPVPEWYYVLVSFMGTVPDVRAFRIVDGAISEQPITVIGSLPFTTF